MKKILISALFAVSCICASAQSSTVAQADSAYMADDFATAATLYQQAIDELGGSVERYYNLGNAYFRLDRPGMAVVNYERALRLDPTNADVRDNLEFVNSRITDRIDPSDSFLSDTFSSMLQFMRPNSWAWIAMGVFILALAGVCIYFFASSVMMRKVGFFGGGVALILAFVLCIFAWHSAKRAEASGQAVIITPSVILSTTPRQPKDRTEEAFLLHEGTKVNILDSIADHTASGGVWYDVTVDREHRAWIHSDNVEKI